jgi:hypothetical protein
MQADVWMEQRWSREKEAIRFRVGLGQDGDQETAVPAGLEQYINCPVISGSCCDNKFKNLKD